MSALLDCGAENICYLYCGSNCGPSKKIDVYPSSQAIGHPTNGLDT